MLSREENALLTRVDRGTPMGTTLRRYWIPALLASELPEPDCPPVRVRLLGEDLVAFRDTRGRIGLLDECCPHRGASLFFGRNEECGLRCAYHGWKYDADGRCVDMLNEPEELHFKEKIHITSYPTEELGGIVWAYLGPPERRAPLPKFAWTQAPPTHRHVSKVIQESNWLQESRAASTRRTRRSFIACSRTPPIVRVSNRRIRSSAARPRGLWSI